MSAPQIDFFYDAVSPYAYLAATQIEALAQRHGAQLRWRPFFLGKVLEASANRPPLTVPAKFRYMLDDLQLWARLYGVPLRKPDNFPASTVSAQRIACALDGARLAAWAPASCRAYWGEGRDISQPEVLGAIAGELGWNPDEILALAQSAPAKEQLRLNTEEALSRGAFGAPAIFLGERMFWGNDRLVLLEACLAGKL